MKRLAVILLCVVFMFSIVGCASDPGRYNTQRGAAGGAVVGLVLGHIFGDALIGALSGAVIGGLVGNAVDQSEQAKRQAVSENRRVVYYDQHQAIESIPGPQTKTIFENGQRTDCRKVTTRTWNQGQITKEVVEEVCEGVKTTNTY